MQTEIQLFALLAPSGGGRFPRLPGTPPRVEVLYQYGYFTSLEAAEIKFRTRSVLPTEREKRPPPKRVTNLSGDYPVCGIRAIEEEV